MVKNLEYICYEDEELFNFDEFDTFLDCNPVKKAKMLSERLLQHLIINNHVLYIYDSVTVTYKIVTQLTIDYLLMLSRKLVVESYERLDIKEKKSFRGYNLLDIFKLDYFKDFIYDVYNMLVNDSIIFDQSSKHITHYKVK